MKNKIILIGLIALMMFTLSCTKKIYFTQNLRKNIENKKLDIKKVQFYISNTVILQRVMPINEAKIARGEIVFENGNYIDQIIIAKNTPGTCDSFTNDKLFISFENDNTVTFHKKNQDNFYKILLNKNIGSYYGIVYDTLIYNVDSKAENTRLWIKKDEIYRQEINQRVVKGKTVK